MKKNLIYLFSIIFLLLISNINCYADDYSDSLFKNSSSDNLYIPVEKMTGGMLYGIVHIYIKEQKYKEAIELTEKLIKEYPYIPQGYILLARAKERIGDTKDLEEIYTECIKQEPRDERAYLYRAEIRYRQKRYKEAIEDYNKVIEISRGKSSKIGLIYFNMATSKYFDGNKKEALDDYNKAISLDKKLENNAQFYFNRGICKFDLGDIEGAKEDYQKAITLNPNAGYLYYDSVK